jgi:hypothetical protein
MLEAEGIAHVIGPFGVKNHDILGPMPPYFARFPALASFRRISETMRTRAQKYP